MLFPFPLTPSLWGVTYAFMHLLIQQAFTERLLYTWPSSGCCGYRDTPVHETKIVPLLAGEASHGQETNEDTFRIGRSCKGIKEVMC